MVVPSPVPTAAGRDPLPAESPSTLTVLIADAFEASGLAALRRLGGPVEHRPGLSSEALPDAAAEVDPDVLIVRSTKVSEAVFARARRLSLVIRAGAGYDNISVKAASNHGVFVANCPGKNAQAVAELAWGLILCCDRRLPDQTLDLRAGAWKKKEYAAARGLYGRTLGIVGLGRIGEAVAHRGAAFGMPVIAWSRSLSRERAEMLGITACENPLEVAAGADVVSLHVASVPETKHLVNDAFLGAMKNGAYLVNTSRGDVVDEAAVRRAVRDKGLRVAFDVWAHQPTPSDAVFENDLVRESGVYGTHHSGASTEQAQQAIAAETVRILQVYGQTGSVPNCVNRAAASPATSLLTVRHLNRSGVLAHVFQLLSEGGINVEEMENVIYDGAGAACARIQLDSSPTTEQVQRMKQNENILAITVSAVR